MDISTLREEARDILDAYFDGFPAVRAAIPPRGLRWAQGRDSRQRSLPGFVRHGWQTTR